MLISKKKIKLPLHYILSHDTTLDYIVCERIKIFSQNRNALTLLESLNQDGSFEKRRWRWGVPVEHHRPADRQQLGRHFLQDLLSILQKNQGILQQQKHWVSGKQWTIEFPKHFFLQKINFKEFLAKKLS